MKFTIAPLLLSSVFASKAGKLAKFPKAKAKAAKSAYYGSLSASMSVGPEPPITVTGCGEIFTNQKVVLTDNLNCGPLVGGDPQDQEDCAVTLNGPEAEIDCDDFKLSQVATPPFYNGGPYQSGICLINGAKATNCNVKKFVDGIYVTDGGEVRSSFLTSNWFGIYAVFTEDGTLTIEDTDAKSNVNRGLGIGVFVDGVNAQLIVKGNVNINSNIIGMYSFLGANTKLDIAVLNDATLNLEQNRYGFFADFEDVDVVSGAELNVEVKENGTLESCGNIVYDIYGKVKASATATFSGTGYTCDQAKVVFIVLGGGTVGTVVLPNCQVCPSN
eukprot:scaffold4266_cov139-Skeletonema_menzelii.AAC.1